MVVDFALAAAQSLFGLAQHLALHQDLDHALVTAGVDQVGPFALTRAFELSDLYVARDAISLFATVRGRATISVSR